MATTTEKPRVTLQTAIGPVDFIIWSPTSVVAFVDQANPITVNRVPISLRVDFGISENPHSPRFGEISAQHVSISKVGGDWTWQPSWTLRDKVTDALLAALEAHLADPEVAFQAQLGHLQREAERARAAATKGQEVAANLEAEAVAASQAVHQFAAQKGTS